MVPRAAIQTSLAELQEHGTVFQRLSEPTYTPSTAALASHKTWYASERHSETEASAELTGLAFGLRQGQLRSGLLLRYALFEP